MVAETEAVGGNEDDDGVGEFTEGTGGGGGGFGWGEGEEEKGEGDGGDERHGGDEIENERVRRR